MFLNLLFSLTLLPLKCHKVAVAECSCHFTKWSPQWKCSKNDFPFIYHLNQLGDKVKYGSHFLHIFSTFILRAGTFQLPVIRSSFCQQVTDTITCLKITRLTFRDFTLTIYKRISQSGFFSMYELRVLLIIAIWTDRIIPSAGLCLVSTLFPLPKRNRAARTVEWDRFGC